jgi:hypothetical protein
MDGEGRESKRWWDIHTQQGDTTLDSQLVLARGDLDTLLFVLLSAHPELLSILHDLSEHGSSEEHHVLAARRVFNAALELGELGFVSLQYLQEINC